MKATTFRWAVAAVAATLALSACASGTGDTDSGVDYDPDATLSGTLTTMGFGAGDEIATTRLDEAKKALGSDVDVKLVEGDLDIQVLLSAIAAGDPPDIINANRDQIGSFAARGAIMSLDECIAGEGIDTDQYRDAAINQVTFNGHVYGIPEFNSIQMTMANTALMQQAGVTIDDVNGSDWDAMADANKAMAKSSDGKIQVIGVDSKMPEFLPLWVKGNGGQLLSDDGRTAMLDDPKVIEAVEAAVGIYDAQGGFPAVKAYRDSADFFGGGNQFATNVLGSMWMEQWYVNVLNDVSPDATITFDTIHAKNGDTIAYGTGSAWAIPKGSKNAAAACRFAKAMTSVDSWVAAANARIALRSADGKPFTGLLTANEKADEAVRALVTPSDSAQWQSAIDAMYEANDHSFSQAASPADAEFKTAWQDGVNRVLNGQASAADSMKQAQQEAQKALDAAWAKIDKK